MLILLLPLTTICVALAGFYVWHRQLIRKRLFEVAEAGLSAFSHAEAAVAYARRPIHEAGEGSSRKRAADELPAHSELRDRLYAPLERLRHHNDAFGELERAAFNVEVHFGDQVARHLREPLRAYNRIGCSDLVPDEPHGAARTRPGQVRNGPLVGKRRLCVGHKVRRLQRRRLS